MIDVPGSLSVVIPTRDRPDRLRTSLAAVTASIRESDEVIVVDSASGDRAAIASIAASAGARLVRCDRPGASVARNAGWRAATHDLVAFVDDDVTVDVGWAAAAAQRFAASPGTAFVTGRITAPPGSGTMTVAVKDDAGAHVVAHLDGGVMGHSANLAVRRADLVAVGGFDELLGAGGRWRAAEDTDLLDRITASGRPGYYEPAASASHEQWRRIREWVVLQHWYGVGSGARLSKLWRTDRARWRVVVRDDVVTWGVAQLPGELARRDYYRALGTVLRLVGMVRGFAAGSLTRVEAGHFRSRNSSS